jgi:hypothetical protein
LVPSPRNPNWKAASVLWYPAIFIQHHESHAGQKDKYEFLWLGCTDGSTYISMTSDLPLMMQGTFFRAQKFCQEIDEVQLTAKQVRNYYSVK